MKDFQIEAVTYSTGVPDLVYSTTTTSSAPVSVSSSSAAPIPSRSASSIQFSLSHTSGSKYHISTTGGLPPYTVSGCQTSLLWRFTLTCTDFACAASLAAWAGSRRPNVAPLHHLLRHRPRSIRWQIFICGAHHFEEQMLTACHPNRTSGATAAHRHTGPHLLVNNLGREASECLLLFN